MPELRRVFHSPRAICEAAITRVAVELGQLEQVLISGASTAGPELLLLDEPPDPGRRAVAEVHRGLGDRERPWRARRARHRHTSKASSSWPSWPVLACHRGHAPLQGDRAAPISGAVLCPVPSRVRRFQPEPLISLFMTMFMIMTWI